MSTPSLLPHHLCNVTGTFLDPRCTFGIRDILPQVCFYLHASWTEADGECPCTLPWCRVARTMEVRGKDHNFRCRLGLTRPGESLELTIMCGTDVFRLMVICSDHDDSTTYEVRDWLTQTSGNMCLTIPNYSSNCPHTQQDFCQDLIVIAATARMEVLHVNVDWTCSAWVENLRRRLYDHVPYVRAMLALPSPRDIRSFFAEVVSEFCGGVPTFPRWHFVTQSAPLDTCSK